MFFIQYKKPTLFYLFVVLIISFGFINSFVNAEEDYLLLPEESLEVVNNSEAFDSESYRSSDDYEESRTTPKRKSSKKTNPLLISDSAFTSGRPVTFQELMTRVALIVLFLFGILIFVKMVMSKNRFDRPGNLFDNLAQKFNSTFSGFSNHQELKLVQTLMLTPGQNIYMVEVEGKKLLIGGTQQGGIQFLADLTKSDANGNGIIDFRQIEDLQIQTQNQNPEKHMPFNSVNEPAEPVKDLSKQAFKRRVNFRQSLLSKSITESDNLTSAR